LSELFKDAFIKTVPLLPENESTREDWRLFLLDKTNTY